VILDAGRVETLKYAMYSSCFYHTVWTKDEKRCCKLSCLAALL